MIPHLHRSSHCSLVEPLLVLLSLSSTVLMRQIPVSVACFKHGQEFVAAVVEVSVVAIVFSCCCCRCSYLRSPCFRVTQIISSLSFSRHSLSTPPSLIGMQMSCSLHHLCYLLASASIPTPIHIQMRIQIQIQIQNPDLILTLICPLFSFSSSLRALTR